MNSLKKFNIGSIVLLPFVMVLLIFSITSCGGDGRSRRGEPAANDTTTSAQDGDMENLEPGETVPAHKFTKINKVTFYIENSASMFGYVNGYTQYVDVLTELAEKPSFARENTDRVFNFINGGEEIKITTIGDNPSQLRPKLNVKGYKCGDYKHSNLNEMFKIALDDANNGNISILISDGIYDVDAGSNSANAIVSQGKATRTKFIEKLSKSNVQTIMVKLKSDFNGSYYHVSKKGSTKIDQARPYYIWIIGESELLNKYFSTDYLSGLKGYESMARFLKTGATDLPYQVTTYAKKGKYKPDQSNSNILNDVEMARNGGGFGFSIAVDYSSLPFSDVFFESIDNYTVDGHFTITKVERYDQIGKKLYGIPFTPTHIITVHSDGKPYGKLVINLKNRFPSWINNSNMENDIDIINDSRHTVGLQYLTQGIGDAYQEFSNKDNNIASFKIEINY
jgi:hypothetical protein